MTDTIDATVSGLGHAGDGLIQDKTRTLFVPWTVTGDRVRVRTDDGPRAALVEVLSPSVDRIEPVCRHFGDCGGCVAQHFNDATYDAWRKEQILRSLQKQGFEEPPVENVIGTQQSARRRATMAWRRVQGDIAVGFRARGTHRIVNMTMCSALLPEIVAALCHLRDLAARLESAGRFDITACDNGLDVTIEQKREPTLTMRDAITEFASTGHIARVSWRAGQGGAPDLVIQHQRPVATISGIPLVLPPGTFLQPSVPGEIALQNLVDTLTGEAKRAADLFCGCGTLTLALAQRCHVTAVDSDAHAIDALRAAAGSAGARGRSISVHAVTRDLYRQPLSESEVKPYDVVVFDPPRAGAAAQAALLASSKVPRIVAVSCNPGTFARDARILVDGGYALRRVVPVDQFVWSQHIEVAALFER
jgi:23S rRNA (uracil1939-C5)-methyltransferase